MPGSFRRWASYGFAALVAIGLAGCNSSSPLTDGLTPTAQMRSDAVAAPVPPGTVGSETALAATPPQRNDATQMALRQPGATGQQASLSPTGAAAPIAFLPVTGAPQSAVTSLAGAMRSAAQSASVPVVVSVDQGAQYQLRGYFSALNDGSGVTLVYVWDVLDRSGARVHRISGQERGGASANDPWTGVSADMMDRVARETMNGLRNWMSNRRTG